MTDELKAFRNDLRAAGQPYSLWGARIVGVGFALLVIIQVIGLTRPMMLMQFGLLLLALCIVVLGIGWAMLIVAFVRRRKWAKAHPLQEPSLTDVS